MTVRNQFRLIVYRFHEKGLEVLMMNSKDEVTNNILFDGKVFLDQFEHQIQKYQAIELEGPEENGIRALAIEADWHDLPKVRHLLVQDLHMVKDVLYTKSAEMQGSYGSVKEAFKKLLPHEYSFLKELKDILLDRNTIRNI